MSNNRESFEALKAEIHMARDTNEILSLANKKFIEEIEAQAKRIEELEAATEHLGLTPKQAADGLARYKAQVAEIESLRKQVENTESRIGGWQIDIEKRLCKILNRDWKPSGFSIMTLCDDLERALSASKNGE